MRFGSSYPSTLPTPTLTFPPGLSSIPAQKAAPPHFPFSEALPCTPPSHSPQWPWSSLRRQKKPKWWWKSAEPKDSGPAGHQPWRPGAYSAWQEGEQTVGLAADRPDSICGPEAPPLLFSALISKVGPQQCPLHHTSLCALTVHRSEGMQLTSGGA